VFIGVLPDFCYRTVTRKASVMPGKLLELVLERTGEKTPARKTSGGRLGKAPVQQGVGWSGYRRKLHITRRGRVDD
jgi:hypothetical protein